jgi:hypothetical protein
MKPSPNATLPPWLELPALATRRRGKHGHIDSADRTDVDSVETGSSDSTPRVLDV